ncbi:hypothetical protein KACHI17_25840 [Sediminibacterium sp. KACHI17]|uniref:Uncharacterized protein n=2 Tax=Sediminibacterium sp. KACHI17 TaxID=1751071 RepID=A0AAT9GLY4_9BACT
MCWRYQNVKKEDFFRTVQQFPHLKYQAEKQTTMKRNSFIVLTSLFLLITAGCEKNEQTNTEGCIRVKVLDAVCNTAVLQILDPAYYHLGENGYQKNGVTYDHVFGTSMPCRLPNNTSPGRPEQGVADKPMYVKIIDQPEPSDPNCGTCLAVISNAPSKWLHVSFSPQCNSN